MKTKIAFVAATISDAWGGSEELWSQVATHLVSEGFSVAASVQGSSRPHHRVQDLAKRGVFVSRRHGWPIWKRVWQKVRADRRGFDAAQIEEFLSASHPTLAVLSTGAALPSIEAVEFCGTKRIPFVTISQANFEGWWFEDELAERYRRALPKALRCYFVSRANLRLAENQIGCELPNAEIVRSPFNVDFDASLSWPKNNSDEFRMACVGRLHIPSKGQDILLEALTGQAWIDRPWRLTFYGDGPMKAGIERLIARYKLQDRVRLAGYVSSVEQIWAENHALVLPSRYEGLPLTIVEAMLCSRPVIATDVAGNSEVVEDGITGFLASAPTVPSVAEALERFWQRRTDLRTMGEAAAKSIRKSVPEKPAVVFAEKLKSLMNDARND